MTSRAQAARAAVWWRSRPGPAIRRIRARSGAAAGSEPDGLLRVAVAQVRARLYGSAEEFAERMVAFVEEARARGAVLLVFPEDNGTQLLGMLPGLTGLAAQTDLSAGESQTAGTTIGDVCRFMSHYTWRAFAAIFAELAKGLRHPHRQRQYPAAGSRRTSGQHIVLFRAGRAIARYPGETASDAE